MTFTAYTIAFAAAFAAHRGLETGLDAEKGVRPCHLPISPTAPNLDPCQDQTAATTPAHATT